MLRKLFLLTAVASLFFLATAETSHARMWTRGNPGIHGNIHGLTYRSSTWERKYGTQRRQPVRRTRTRFFRWR